MAEHCRFCDKADRPAIRACKCRSGDVMAHPACIVERINVARCNRCGALYSTPTLDNLCGEVNAAIRYLALIGAGTLFTMVAFAAGFSASQFAPAIDPLHFYLVCLAAWAALFGFISLTLLPLIMFEFPPWLVTAVLSARLLRWAWRPATPALPISKR